MSPGHVFLLTVALMPIVVFNMKKFFDENVLLDNQIAIDLYKEVEDLPNQVKKHMADL